MIAQTSQPGTPEDGLDRIGGPTSRPESLFISDCHLCADESATDRARQERVCRFLHAIDPATTHLYIVGDLFDFWFSYGSAVPRRGFQVLAELAVLRRRGLPITFIAGNHDYWALPFLRQELDCETNAGTLRRTLYGHRFLIAHGDGLGDGDLAYKLMKRLLRHPLAIALYRLLHPALGFRLATAISRLSRAQAAHDERPQIERLFRQVAEPAFAAGEEIAIFGHFHLPVLRRAKEHTMVVLGDWISHFSYLRVTARGMELVQQTEDGGTRRLAGRSWEEEGATACHHD